jgi:hypothetical protein
VRAAIAAVVAGCIWQLWGPGRFRCASVGAAAHLIAFAGTGSATTGTEWFATLVGAVVVMIGSGVVGMVREQRPADRPAA